MKLIIIILGIIALLYFTLQAPTESFKTHKWCVVDCGGPTGESNGYSSSNDDCQKRCTLNNGISCGMNWQNCCVEKKNMCVHHIFGDICDARIAVSNCTSP